MLDTCGVEYVAVRLTRRQSMFKVGQHRSRADNRMCREAGYTKEDTLNLVIGP